MLSAVFSGLTTKAAIASGLIGALLALAPATLAGHTFGYGKATKEFRRDRDAALRREDIALQREIALWTELAASRAMQVVLVEGTERFWDVSAEAQAEMRRELGKHKAASKRSADMAADAIRRLGEIQHEWKDVEVPRVVLEPFCLRDPGKAGCDPAAPGAGAPDGVALRKLAAGDGGGVDK
jgi:hypothetical protein